MGIIAEGRLENQMTVSLFSRVFFSRDFVFVFCFLCFFFVCFLLAFYSVSPMQFK